MRVEERIVERYTRVDPTSSRVVCSVVLRALVLHYPRYLYRLTMAGASGVTYVDITFTDKEEAMDLYLECVQRVSRAV